MQKKILSPSDGGDGQQTEVLPDKGSNSAVVGDAEISSRAAAVLAIDDRSPWATALLDEGLFSVEQTVCIDGKNFLLGPVLKNNRLHIVALVDSGDGRFIPSLFYKSLSQGSWRCSPYIEAMVSRGKKSHDYSKGEEAGRFSYTQTTRVTRQLALVLDTQEQKGNYRKIQGSDLDKYFHEDNFDNLFNDSDFKFNKVLTFAEETSAFDFQEHGFDEDPFGYCREIDRLVRKKRKKARQKDGYEDEEKKYASLLFKYRDDKKRLEEIVMEALTDDPAALIQYYNVYRDESYAGKILEKAIKEAAAIDPKSAITTFHLYKDQPYARKMLKRAIKVVIYTDPELVFTCYEDYAEELNPIEITDRVLRKIAREKPEMFFKYRDEWCKGMPDEEALIKQALKSLFAENSLKSWTYFQNYVDKPYAYEILKAQIEKQAFHVIQHFPVYEDQPYADEILQAALAQDQEAAVRFFEKYQDRPYARRVFRNASRKHPEALLGGLYQRRYRPESPFEKKKLEKLACVTVKVKPGRVLWLCPIFLNNRLDPSRLEELNLLEKAARGSAEKDPGNFFERFEDCIIDKPYADEVLEKALRTALEMCPKIAVENSYLYRDKPYYDEIFLASAMKSAESNPGEMFWCFNDDYSHPPFKDNPYREQILRKTVMAAVEKDPQAAISCFEYYQDQPYAEEMFKKAMAGSADVEKSIPGFVPEFTQENIAAVYSGMHDVVGKYTIEVYEVKYKGQKFEWEMAYDKKGRVWIEGINVADCPVNTFGVRSQFINSGILTKKPFDYHDGNRGLKRGAEKRYYDKSYDDVTPFLDLLPPIKKFRRQRGIFRKRSVQRRSEKN